MNILFCTDKNYFLPTIVSITAIFENNKNERINIFIFHSGLDDYQLKMALSLAEKYNQLISPVFIETYYYDNAPVLRWTRETYFRLLIGEKLPVGLERVLYLDCDVIVNKSLSKFYYSDFDNSCLIAMEEPGNIQALNLDLKSGKYYQAGVILFDFQKSRDFLSYEKTVKVIENIRKKIITVDQDVINVLFDGKIKNLDYIYNDCKITNFCGNNWNRFFNYVDEERMNESVIFHYATGKPWNNLYAGSCENVWYKYLKISPFANLYYKKFFKLKYKILRLGIFKFLFFKYIELTPYINNLFKKIISEKKYNKLKNFYRKKIK